jgi:fermentation-respiration switch protein FrsA (DUF1100 family)
MDKPQSAIGHPQSAIPSVVPRPRRLARRGVIVLVLLVAFGYAAAVVNLMTRETELIFRTSRAKVDARPSFPYQQVDLPRGDGVRQFAWRMEAADAPAAGAERLWLLFLHGNASTVASRMNVAHYERLRALGLNLLAPEYRGYNGLDGAPTEATVAVDARAAYDFLRTQERVPPERLIIFGWSLGGAIAVDLASQVDARAVILEGAPASIADLGQQQYPIFPIRWIIRNPFDAIHRIPRVRAPLLFLHSAEDTIIPIAEGRRLYDAARPPKTFVEVRGGHVEASEVDRDVFYAAVRAHLTAR